MDEFFFSHSVEGGFDGTWFEFGLVADGFEGSWSEAEDIGDFLHGGGEGDVDGVTDEFPVAVEELEGEVLVLHVAASDLEGGVGGSAFDAAEGEDGVAGTCDTDGAEGVVEVVVGGIAFPHVVDEEEGDLEFVGEVLEFSEVSDGVAVLVGLGGGGGEEAGHGVDDDEFAARVLFEGEEEFTEAVVFGFGGGGHWWCFDGEEDIGVLVDAEFFGTVLEAAEGIFEGEDEGFCGGVEFGELVSPVEGHPGFTGLWFTGEDGEADGDLVWDDEAGWWDEHIGEGEGGDGGESWRWEDWEGGELIEGGSFGACEVVDAVFTFVEFEGIGIDDLDMGWGFEGAQELLDGFRVGFSGAICIGPDGDVGDAREW